MIFFFSSIGFILFFFYLLNFYPVTRFLVTPLLVTRYCVAWVSGLPKGIGETRFLVGEGGGGRRESSLPQVFASIFPLFPQKRLILGLVTALLCLITPTVGYVNISELPEFRPDQKDSPQGRIQYFNRQLLGNNIPAFNVINILIFWGMLTGNVYYSEVTIKRWKEM